MGECQIRKSFSKIIIEARVDILASHFLGDGGDKAGNRILLSFEFADVEVLY